VKHRLKYVYSILLFVGLIVLSASALAINGRTTYQAKIYKPDGQPLEAVSVNFRFTVLDPSSSCVLFVEDYAAVNMIGSGGLTSFSLGMGTRTYPASGPTTFAGVFDNSTPSFVCQTPGVYNPISTDNRKVVMQFNEGSGWQTLPAMAINSVPYAMYSAKAQNSTLFNGKADSAFVEVSTLAGLNCQANEAIKFNGATFSCIAVGVSSSGISSVTTSGTVLTTGGTASAPVISITAASMSSDGYLTSLDYAEFKAKLSASSTEIISALGYAPVSSSAVNTQIQGSNLAGDVSGTIAANFVQSVGGKTSVQVATSVDETIAATSSSTADTIVKRNASGNFTANDVYANAAKLNYVDIYKPSTSFNIRLQAPTSLAANYTLNLPTSSGTTGQVLATDGSGNLSWINAATGSVTSVSATAPLVSTGGATPTISITQATSSANGYLSSTDWNTFNNKQQATSAAIIATLGYTPANATSATQWTTNGSDIYYNTGKVGIGTTGIPDENLHVHSTGAFTTLKLSNAATGVGTNNGFMLSVNSIGAGSPSIWNFENTALKFGTNNAEVMRLDSSGNVGVGTSSPSAKLHLAAGTSATASFKLTSGTLLTSPQSGTMEYDGSQFYLTDGANTRRTIATGSSAGTIDNASTINSTGNMSLVPVGSVVVSSTTASTNSQTGALIVKGGMGVAGDIYTSGTIVTSSNIQGVSVTATSGMISPYLYGSTVSGGSLYIDSTTHASKGNILLAPNGGNVGIGTTTPTAALSVTSTVGLIGSFTSTSASNSQLNFNSSTGKNTNIAFQNTGVDKWYVGNDSSNDRFRLHDGVSEVFTVLRSSGNVGVGTTTPGEKFDVFGNMRIGSTDSNYIAFRGTTGDGAGSYDHTYIGERVHAAGESSELLLFKGNDSDNASGPDRIRLAGGNILFDTYATPDAPSGTFEAVATSPMISTKMIIKGNGNVGIGTSAPTQALQVNNSAGSSILRISGVNPELNLDTGTEFSGFQIRRSNEFGPTGWVNKTVESVPLLFGTNNAHRMIIDTSGNVGIGTTTPAGILNIVNTYTGSQVNASTNLPGVSIRSDTDMVGLAMYDRDANEGTVNDRDGMLYFGDDTTDNFRFMYAGSGQPVAEYMRLTGTGNLGIGTTPTQKLEVSGTAKATYFMGDGSQLTNISAANLTFYNYDNLYASGPVSFSAMSQGLTGFQDYTGTAVSVGSSFWAGLTSRNGNSGAQFAVNWNNGGGTPSGFKVRSQDDNFAGWGAWRDVAFVDATVQKSGDTMTGQLVLPSNGLTVGTSQLVVSGGVVGIGTATPSRQLEVYHATSAIFAVSTPTHALYGGADSNHPWIGSSSNSSLRLVTSSTEKMRITADGNVGIGTTAPQELFHVEAPTSGRMQVGTGNILSTSGYGVSLESDTDDGVAYINLHTQSVGANAAALIIRGGHGAAETASSRSIASFRTDSGNVGIGYAAPTSKLQVNGGIKQPNYGQLVVTFDGTTRTVSMPAFLTSAYMDSHIDETFTWRAIGPLLKDAASCATGPTANYYFESFDTTWNGTYRMTIGKVNASLWLVDIEWKGWGANLKDAANAIVSTGSNEGSVHATLSWNGTAWYVEHMGGLVGTTNFACH